MKEKRKKPLSLLLALALFMLLTSTTLFGVNPLVSDVFTADPAAFIGGDGRMYVMNSHDRAGATSYSQLLDYILLSSEDLVNWTNHGVVFDLSVARWAGAAYAPDVAYVNGTYYLYFPNGGANIGVATSSSPTGPWRDPVGGPIVSGSTPGAQGVNWVFDPGVFIDDDGQGYLAFGGGGPGMARIIKLSSNYIGVSGSAVTVDAPRFFEAAYIHKRGNYYYFSYSTDFSAGSPTIDYMMSTSPMSGYSHKGTILRNPWDNIGNNNHASIKPWGGRWFIFYHNRTLSNSVYQRSSCVNELFYNSDGTIQRVIDNKEGVSSPVYNNTETGTPTPEPTPAPPGSIVVRALGTTGNEKIEVRVNGQVVETFTLSTSYQNYEAVGQGRVSVYFINDDDVDSGMDVQVDNIIYEGQLYEAEDQSVNTGVWQDDSCGGSNSEWLHCAGYIEFENAPEGPTDVPTPTPSVVVDVELAIAPVTKKVGVNEPFTLSVELSSQSSMVAAYGIDVNYDANAMMADTDTISDAVEAGSDGYYAAANANTPGIISITGFDVDGVGGGAGFDFLTIYLRSGSNKISSEVSLSINNLTSNTTAPLGGIGISGTVIIGDPVPGCSMVGDGNGDGAVNIVDALLAAQIYVGTVTEVSNRECLDANCDGTVNIVDALLIAQKYVGAVDQLC